MDAVIRGKWAEHVAARDLGREVGRVHTRYATEVVARFKLCPFLRDPETAFGAFCVMLDDEPAIEGVVEFVRESLATVGHVVFPLCRPPPSTWERFSNNVGERLRTEITPSPVLAAFHPDLAGDPGSAHRLVGLLRHAPDPFIQFVPEGLHEGGTVLAGSDAVHADPSEANFVRLQGGGIAEVLALLDDIRKDRDRSYAPYLAAMKQVTEETPT